MHLKIEGHSFHIFSNWSTRVQMSQTVFSCQSATSISGQCSQREMEEPKLEMRDKGCRSGGDRKWNYSVFTFFCLKQEVMSVIRKQVQDRCWWGFIFGGIQPFSLSASQDWELEVPRASATCLPNTLPSLHICISKSPLWVWLYGGLYMYIRIHIYRYYTENLNIV